MGTNPIGRHPSSKSWKTFASRSKKFIRETQEYVLQGLDPGVFIKQYGLGMHPTFSKIGSYQVTLKEYCGRFILYGLIK
ncbi:MAG: hypothetical protein WA364_10240 [Candidatus Nitrosopolaris sp.]